MGLNVGVTKEGWTCNGNLGKQECKKSERNDGKRWEGQREERRKDFETEVPQGSYLLEY